MTDDPPPPFVPANVDLRDFPFTPIFRTRLFGSTFHARASDTGWRLAVTLWLRSWDQLPAGSLPEEDVDLCRLAELGRDLKTWKKHRGEALWGWVRCADGRFYHSVVAEGVTEAWKRKCDQRQRTEKARLAKAEKRQKRSVTDDVTGSKGQEIGDRREGENLQSSFASQTGTETTRHERHRNGFAELLASGQIGGSH